jgi:hypothetical protein
LNFHKEVEKRDIEEEKLEKKKFEGLSFHEEAKGKKLKMLQEKALLVKNDEDRKKILDDLRQLAGKKPFSKEEWESFKKSKEYEDIASQKQVVPTEVWEELARGAYPEYIRHEGPKDDDLLNISKWAVKLAFGKIKNVRGV